jgi:hypothetical protein
MLEPVDSIPGRAFWVGTTYSEEHWKQESLPTLGDVYGR